MSNVDAYTGERLAGLESRHQNVTDASRVGVLAGKETLASAGGIEKGDLRRIVVDEGLAADICDGRKRRVGFDRSNCCN